jgi:hypothetical protein
MPQDDVAYYRGKAAECREAAANELGLDKDAWERLATEWDLLAQERERRRGQ